VKELRLVPSYGGVFEVAVDGQIIFSKKKLGRHPTIDEIQGMLRRMV